MRAKPFTMELGHIGAFKALIDELSAADWQKEEIRQLVEEKNYTALSDLLGELPASPAARALGSAAALIWRRRCFRPGSDTFPKRSISGSAAGTGTAIPSVDTGGSCR